MTRASSRRSPFDCPETSLRSVHADGTVELWFAGAFAVRFRVSQELAPFYRRLVTAGPDGPSPRDGLDDLGSRRAGTLARPSQEEGAA